MTLRSDQIPPALSPLLLAYGYAGAGAIYGTLRLLDRTCRVEVENERAFAAHPSYILCYWHEDAIGGFLAILRRSEPFGSLCHPAWTVKPWEVVGRILGWRVALGSSGHFGKEAAEQVIRWLRDGTCTFICPDGPAGPLRALKRGVLHMAIEAGVPILPLVFDYGRAVKLPRWDEMRLPLPYSTVRVRCGDPIWVTEATLEEAAHALAAALGGVVHVTGH